MVYVSLGYGCATRQFHRPQNDEGSQFPGMRTTLRSRNFTFFSTALHGR
jgi:hypothetical protein